jgi:hypothetical protein
MANENRACIGGVKMRLKIADLYEYENHPHFDDSKKDNKVFFEHFGEKIYIGTLYQYCPDRFNHIVEDNKKVENENN